MKTGGLFSTRCDKVRSMAESEQNNLQTKTWLPLVDGTGVAPENCVCTEGLESIVAKLRQSGAEIAHKEQLESELTSSPGWNTKVRHLCPDGTAIIELVGKAMLRAGGYEVGQTILSRISGEQFLNIFRQSPTELMPMIAVIASIKKHMELKNLDDAIQEHVLKPLQKPLSNNRYLKILKHLGDQPHVVTNEDPTDEAFDAYLSEALESIDVGLMLSEIKLRNRQGEYVSPDFLTTSTTNVDAKHVLDVNHTEILSEVLKSLPVQVAKTAATESRRSIPDESEIKASPGILWNEIQKWRTDDIPADALAALIAVLGDRDEYPELYNRLHPDRNKIEDMWTLLSISEALKYSPKRFCLRVADSKSISVMSVTGVEFQAEVSKVPDSFFDPMQGMPDSHQCSDGTSVFQFRIRPCSVQELRTEQKLEVLCRSVSEIRKFIWKCQSPFDTTWEKLTAEDQLELSVAQRQILGACSALLETQLGVEPDAGGLLTELSELLQQYYDAHTDLLRASSDKSHHRRASAIKMRKETAKQIRQLLISDPTTQQGVMHEIMERLSSQSYDAASVPFEILQNADDAVTELRKHFSEECIEHARPQSLINTFRVESDTNQCRVAFFHWGRAINQYRFNDHVEKRYRRDLEKMLVLQGSGKTHETGVTGHFGLGFKSVFFVSDEPKVFSGTKSRFVVKSGIFPDKLQEDDEERLRGVLQVLESREVPTGTAIELSLRKEHSASSLLRRFREVAGYLVLFSKTIRKLEFAGESPERVEVKQDKLADGVSVTSTLQANGQRAILFRLKGGPPSYACGDQKDHCAYRTVLLHIDRHGLPTEPLPLQNDDQSRIPEIWVTTPAFEHVGRAPIVLNADLDVNPGRTRLRDTKRNTELLQEIGTGFGEMLVRFFEATKANWPSIKKELNSSDTEVTASQFWESFWKVCLPIAKRLPNDPIRCILIGEGRGLSRLMKDMPIIPTGLPAPFDEPVRLTDIRQNGAGLFASTERWELLSQITVKKKPALGWLARMHQPGTIVSSRTINELKEYGFHEAITGITAIGMTEVIAGMLPPSVAVTPALASVLGKIAADGLLPEFDTTGDAASSRERLKRSTFVTKSGAQIAAFELLIGHGKPKDSADIEELMRAGFAPDKLVLSSDYSEIGLRFFRLCRGRVRDESSRTMAAWCLAVENDPEKQKAVATYLARGAKAHELCLDTTGTWLEDHDKFEKAISHLTPGEQTVAKGRINRQDASPPPEPARDEVARSQRPAFEIFRDIAAWWSEKKGSLLKEHDRQIYPFGAFPEINLDATPTQLKQDSNIRREWLTLLIRGQVYRLGHKDVQHRGFLEYPPAEKFIDLLAEGTPDPESIFNLLDDYLNLTGEKLLYFHWMNQILAYYQLSRWLPQYVAAFQGITRSEATTNDLTIDAILNLRQSVVFSRSTGFDAPDTDRMNRIGVHFVLREVIRARQRQSPQYIAQTALSRLSFVPSEGVRRLFYQITGDPVFVSTVDPEVWAKSMFAAVARHVEDPTFDCCFDIPFRMLTWDTEELKKKRKEILGDEVSTIESPDEDSVDAIE
jgi:CheY-like chemotaxis protein